jgi:AcrR family transcriptional regulator
VTAPPPPSTDRKRLSREDRRRQLLATAWNIARRDGADALSLGRLAHEAGVSRPIAYEHFDTRSGLLVALYTEIADRQYEQAQKALNEGADDLATLATRVGQAFMHCYTTTGPEAFAIAAMLKGDATMEAAQTTLIERYVTAYADAFEPFTDLSGSTLVVHFAAIVAAGEALAQRMMAGEIDEPTAANTLASLITAWLPGTTR